MEVHLSPGSLPRLEQVEDLRRFSLVVAGDAALLPRLAEEQQGRIEFAGEEHAWVSTAWLIGAAGRVSPEWRQGFDAMLAFAASKGWVREEPPAIRAHVVWG